MKKPADILANFIIKFRVWIITGTLVLVTFFSVFIFFFQFENDLTLWVDKNSSIGKMPYYINETFGSNSPLLVAVEVDDAFSFNNLTRLKQLTDELAELSSVESVMALSNIDDIIPTENGILVEKLVNYPLPEDTAALQALRTHVLTESQYAGRLVSNDGKTMMVIVKLVFGLKADKAAAEIRGLSEKVFSGENTKLYFSGNTFIMNSISEIVTGDLIFLVPIVTILILGILYLSFKTIRGVMLPLITVILTAAMTMGIMSFLQVPLNVMSSAIPVILIAVGSAYGIHVLNNYYETVAVEGGKPEKNKVVSHMIRHVGLPVLMAGLTTIAGFISNITAQVSLIKTFGIFTALGVTLAMIIALLFIPALLSVMPLPKKKSVKTDKIEPVPDNKKIAARCADFVIKHRWAVVGVFAALSIVSLFFATQVTAKVDMLGYFTEDSEPRQASAFINEKFGGFNPLSVYVKADALDPDVLKTMMLFEENLKAYDNLNPPSGLPDVITELNYAMTGFSTIPETKAEIENLLFFVEGKDMLSSVVTKDRGETIVTVLLPSMSNTYIEKLFFFINGFLDEYRNGIAVEKNYPEHPALMETQRLLLTNLLRKESIEQNEEALKTAVDALAKAASSFVTAIDYNKVYKYAISDEAEIILEKEEAANLVSKLKSMRQPDMEKVKIAINNSFVYATDFTDKEIAAFARSVLQQLEESGDSAKMAFLTKKLVELYPGLADTSQSRINHVISPFFWKTIPVGKKAGDVNAATATSLPADTGTTGMTSRLVRETPVEKMMITGTAKLMADIKDNIFANQITSILIAILAVFILNTITFKSALEGLVSLAAIVFTILINFGIMGVFGISLDFVTAIIAGVTIGTGIDYTIHFMTRFSRELESGASSRDAFVKTLATTGKAIIFNAVSVGLGFAVLIFSNVQPFHTAGIMLAASMATSSLAAMTLMPAVLVITKVTERRIKKMLLKQNQHKEGVLT